MSEPRMVPLASSRSTCQITQASSSSPLATVLRKVAVPSGYRVHAEPSNIVLSPFLISLQVNCQGFDPVRRSAEAFDASKMTDGSMSAALPFDMFTLDVDLMRGATG